MNEAQPAWSPDGSQLVVSSVDCSYYYGCYPQLYLIRPNGTNRLLINGAYGTEPSWSPDGTIILYSSGCSTAGCAAIVATRESGGNQGIVVTGNVASPDWRR